MEQYNEQNYELFTGRIMFDNGTSPKILDYTPIQMINSQKKGSYLDTLTKKNIDVEK